MKVQRSSSRFEYSIAASGVPYDLPYEVSGTMGALCHSVVGTGIIHFLTSPLYCMISLYLPSHFSYESLPHCSHCLPLIHSSYLSFLVLSNMPISVDINECPRPPITPPSPPNKRQHRYRRLFKTSVFAAFRSFLHLASSDKCNLGEVFVTGDSSSSDTLPSFYRSASRFSD